MMRSFVQSVRILSRAQLAGPPLYASTSALGMPLTTFRSYATPTKDEHTESSPQGPSSDEVAHTDSAYDGSSANPKDAAKGVEDETGQGLKTSAANPKASEPPQKPLQTSKSDAQKSDTEQ